MKNFNNREDYISDLAKEYEEMLRDIVQTKKSDDYFHSIKRIIESDEAAKRCLIKVSKKNKRRDFFTYFFKLLSCVNLILIPIIILTLSRLDIEEEKTLNIIAVFSTGCILSFYIFSGILNHLFISFKHKHLTLSNLSDPTSLWKYWEMIVNSVSGDEFNITGVRSIRYMRLKRLITKSEADIITNLYNLRNSCVYSDGDSSAYDYRSTVDNSKMLLDKLRQSIDREQNTSKVHFI